MPASLTVFVLALANLGNTVQMKYPISVKLPKVAKACTTSAATAAPTGSFTKIFANVNATLRSCQLLMIYNTLNIAIICFTRHQLYFNIIKSQSVS